MGNIRGFEWLIILGLVVLLFGAKKLPDAARGLGRSLRIFKAETKGLIEDDAKKTPEADVTDKATPVVNVAETPTQENTARPNAS